MKVYLTIFLVLSLFFCSCIKYVVFDTWGNGIPKEVKRFKNKKNLSTIYYNENGLKKEANYYKREDNLISEKHLYNDFGLLKTIIIFKKYDYDTVFFEAESKYKIFSIPSFFQKEYHNNGKVAMTGYYSMNKKDSIFTYYDVNGKINLIEFYRLDSLLKGTKY